MVLSLESKSRINTLLFFQQTIKILNVNAIKPLRAGFVSTLQEGNLKQIFFYSFVFEMIYMIDALSSSTHEELTMALFI